MFIFIDACFLSPSLFDPHVCWQVCIADRQTEKLPSTFISHGLLSVSLCFTQLFTSPSTLFKAGGRKPLTKEVAHNLIWL